MSAVGINQLMQNGIVSFDPSLPEQSSGSLRAKSADIQMPIALERLQVGQRKPAGDQDGRPAPSLGDSGQKSLEQRVFDLAISPGVFLALDSLQTIQHQQIGSARRQGFPQ